MPSRRKVGKASSRELSTHSDANSNIHSDVGEAGSQSDVACMSDDDQSRNGVGRSQSLGDGISEISLPQDNIENGKSKPLNEPESSPDSESEDDSSDDWKPGP